MGKRKIVIVGGALSGPTAAARAREIDEDARIILLERNDNVSYATCGIAYALSGEVTDPQQLNAQKHDFFKDFYNVEVRTRVEVLKLNAESKKIKISSNGEIQSLKYDVLVYSTGVESKVPDTIGASISNVVSFRTMGDLQKIQELIQSGKKNVVILGAGPMGIEAADGLLRAGAHVTLVEKNPDILSNNFTTFGIIAHKELIRQDARVLTNSKIIEYKTNENILTHVVTNDGNNIALDLLIVTMGVTARSKILANAGAKLNKDKSIKLDRKCRTSLKGVYACGTGVSITQALTRKKVQIPQAAIADKTAQIAGANAAGGNFRLPEFTGSQIMRIGEFCLGRTGLTRKQARNLAGKKNIATTQITSYSRESFMPGCSEIFLELFYNKKNGKILGLEAAGNHEIAGRIDIASSMILSGSTIKDLAMLDLAYAPPFRPVRDPVNTLATVADLVSSGYGKIISPWDFIHRSSEFTVLNLCETKTENFNCANTIHMKLADIRNASEIQLPKSGTVIVSGNGREAWLALRLLKQRGFKKLKILGGGLIMYQAIKDSSDS